MKKENRIPLQILLQAILCIGLVFVVYAVTFRDITASSLSGGSQSQADGIKTAIVGTANALLGPFPTLTMPTKTDTSTPTATMRISATPTMTASATITIAPQKLVFPFSPKRP